MSQKVAGGVDQRSMSIVQVFWPIAVTMLVTELVPTDWTFADGSGAAPFQAVLAAVFSVKVISRVPR
jgi:hypothetical protein